MQCSDLYQRLSNMYTGLPSLLCNPPPSSLSDHTCFRPVTCWHFHWRSDRFPVATVWRCWRIPGGQQQKCNSSFNSIYFRPITQNLMSHQSSNYNFLFQRQWWIDIHDLLHMQEVPNRFLQYPHCYTHHPIMSWLVFLKQITAFILNVFTFFFNKNAQVPHRVSAENPEDFSGAELKSTWSFQQMRHNLRRHKMMCLCVCWRSRGGLG